MNDEIENEECGLENNLHKYYWEVKSGSNWYYHQARPAMETTGNIVSIERSGPAIYNTWVGIQIHFYYENKSYLTGIQQMIV